MKYNREKFLNAVKTQLEPNIASHSLALEACMKGIYEFSESEGRIIENEPVKEDWLLAGLIHDIDYSGEYKKDHPNKTKEVLAKYDLEISDVVDRIVKAHAPDLTGVEPANLAEWSIFCADSLTGLIVAVALVYPTKKLADVKLKSVVKRFIKEPRFAAGTRREDVAKCADETGLNIPLEKFIEICLTSMQGIAEEIGL